MRTHAPFAQPTTITSKHKMDSNYWAPNFKARDVPKQQPLSCQQSSEHEQYYLERMLVALPTFTHEDTNHGHQLVYREPMSVKQTTADHAQPLKCHRWYQIQSRVSRSFDSPWPYCVWAEVRSSYNPATLRAARCRKGKDAPFEFLG